MRRGGPPAELAALHTATADGQSIPIEMPSILKLEIVGRPLEVRNAEYCLNLIYPPTVEISTGFVESFIDLARMRFLWIGRRRVSRPWQQVSQGF